MSTDGIDTSSLDLLAQSQYLEQQIEINKLEKERAEYLGNQLEATRKQIAMSQERILQTKQMLDSLKKENLSLEDQLEAAAALGEQFQKTRTELSALGADTLNEYDKLMKDLEGKLEDINDELKQGVEDADELEKIEKRRQKILEDMSDVQLKFNGRLKDAQGSGEKVSSAISGVASKLGIATKFSDTLVGKMGEFYAEVNEGDGSLTGLVEKMGGAAMQDLATGAIASLIDKAIELAIQMDSVSKEFEKANGFTANFGIEIGRISSDLMLAGMGAKEASGAMQGLVTNFSAFNPQATQTNVNLAKNVAMMNSFGVSTDASTKMLDNFVRAQGMTAEAATNMALKVSYAGDAIGISASKMSADFNATYGTLSQFGDGATDIFLDMQAQAKATGVAIGELVKVAQKFDTFSDAATTVSQLNTVLGTNLSAMELMNADYDDRLNLLREGMMLDGQAFESLDRYTKLYVQNALGVSSAAEAQKLLNMNTAEYAGYKSDMEAAQMSQQQLNDAVIAAVPIATKLTNALTSVARVFMPIIEVIAKFFDLISELDGFMSGTLIPTLTALGLAAAISTMSVTTLSGALATLFAPLIVGFVIGNMVIQIILIKAATIAIEIS